MDVLSALAGRNAASMPLDVLASLTMLSVAPFLLVMCTSFVRIIVVLSLVRSAIGAAALPPNTVLTGLALVLTAVIMNPTFTRISHDAIEPYAKGKIAQGTCLTRAIVPLREFMTHQTRLADIVLFARAAHVDEQSPARVPLTVLIPAFVVGELRDGFAIGFALYLPFVAIDFAVAAILMGLGMFMLSPPVVSLPVKLLLFVMVDGWALVCGGVVSSFR
ncbi:MAG TPA: flagellar type III secretion system pore protein FliP [Candidatus Baltobacteraceae bacterium]|nr:flagellar type III secretion system pore protein FliP [Candidatus Baltobacteraceae bacterium]